MNQRFPVTRLIDWYTQNKRDLPFRHTTDIYAIWLSEVMLQQTQVVSAIPYYLRFLETFPTIEHLANGSEQEVLKLWEGLGYYSRVRNFHRAARQVMEQFGGRIPTTLTDFESLPGVGSYIAAAVLSIACHVPIPTVDGNVIRVYTRFWAIADDIRKNALRKRIYRELETIIPHEAPGDFNQAMMELGATVCTPRTPACPCCPLQTGCTAYMTGTIDRYPFKSPGAKVPEYRVSIGVIFREGRIYIQQRPPNGLLGGMWEFPGGKSQGDETPEETLVRECREELRTEVEIIERLATVRHAYSHFKIEMTVFICRLKAKEPDVRPREETPFRWMTIEELETYPFPGANHKFFPALRRYIQGLNRV
ncbi:MAG: A/G-specific adenine glycosylase [Candidatus Omnitrophota bacterium]